jgi:N-methylhydantoinase A
MALQLGVDTGGTFTDFVLYDEGAQKLAAWKVLSTPGDPAAAVIDGLRRIDEVGRVDILRLGTTVATNALLERRGAVVAYIATRGFRDVPFIQRGNRRFHYDLAWVKPKPFCRRRHAYEITERIDSAGRILEPLDEAEVRALARRLAAEGEVEAVAVNLLFSFLRPDHELRVREIFAAEAPLLPVSLASELDPKWKEDQRATTAIADAFIKPVVGRQLGDLERRLRAAGLGGRTGLIKSNGSETTVAAAAAAPIHLAVSGPTGGVVASRQLARLKRLDNVVTLDIGGTSTDVSTIIAGTEKVTTDFELEFGVPLRVPMIDIRTIGAGGGSIAYLDKVGVLQVGPRSAGAKPGPACYGFGGEAPTVTDANLVLGRIAADNFLGGAMRLDVGRAERAIATLAEPLGWSLEEAALAIVRIADNAVVGALRAVLVEQGHDPRSFALVAFGGAGPLHICDLMREASIPQGIVPNHPGQFSAYGFTMTDARTDRHRSVLLSSARFDAARANAVMAALVDSAVGDLKAQGYGDRPTVIRALDMRYLGQNYELEVVIVFDRFTQETIAALWRSFHERFARRYQFSLPGATVEIVDMKCTAICEAPHPTAPELAPGDGPPAARTVRRVVFAEGARDTPIYDRADLQARQAITGPAIVEEDASATVLAPGARLEVDRWGNLCITL